MVYIILFVIVVFIVMVLYNDDGGCLKLGLFYVAVLLVMLGIISLQRYCQSPRFNSNIVVETPYSKAYRFSHSQYLCPSAQSYYCVEKSDSLPPSRTDVCIHCGKLFWSHHYKKTFEEEEIDRLFWERVAQTPAE